EAEDDLVVEAVRRAAGRSPGQEPPCT
ncbi:MAG: hypothetical protein QOK15_1409, partial [Nocardioidaceae bacterium]|nr:hypothetical protein [Nocardioidaceae bacterium]